MQWIYSLALKPNKHLKLMPQQISLRQAGASQMFRREEIKGGRESDKERVKALVPPGAFTSFLHDHSCVTGVRAGRCLPGNDIGNEAYFNSVCTLRRSG